MRKDTYEDLGVGIVAAVDGPVGRLGEISFLMLEVTPRQRRTRVIGAVMMRAVEVVSGRQDDIVDDTTISC